MAATSIETLARRIITGADHTVTKLHKVLAPNAAGESEVLFEGKYAGNKKVGLPGDENDGLYRCIVRGDGNGYVLEGW